MGSVLTGFPGSMFFLICFFDWIHIFGWILMEFIGVWMNSNRFWFCRRILMDFFWMKFHGIDVSFLF